MTPKTERSPAIAATSQGKVGDQAAAWCKRETRVMAASSRATVATRAVLRTDRRARSEVDSARLAHGMDQAVSNGRRTIAAMDATGRASAGKMRAVNDVVAATRREVVVAADRCATARVGVLHVPLVVATPHALGAAARRAMVPAAAHLAPPTVVTPHAQVAVARCAMARAVVRPDPPEAAALRAMAQQISVVLDAAAIQARVVGRMMLRSTATSATIEKSGAATGRGDVTHGA